MHAPKRSPKPKTKRKSLSDAQLARKRANDREAQRIIRQRTREHIENLERQVAELGEQLDKALQYSSELETQNGVLQRQFAEMTVQLQYALPYGIDIRLRHPFYRR